MQVLFDGFETAWDEQKIELLTLLNKEELSYFYCGCFYLQIYVHMYIFIYIYVCTLMMHKLLKTL